MRGGGCSAALAALLVSAWAAACAPSASASFCWRLATDLPRLFASLTAWAWSESIASNLTWARFASLESRRASRFALFARVFNRSASRAAD